MLVENYLQNIHETHSMTTETSDSGIRTHGATSEIEMEEISGNYFILVTACQFPKCLVDSSVTFQQDRKTLSYSVSTCNLRLEVGRTSGFSTRYLIYKRIEINERFRN